MALFDSYTAAGGLQFDATRHGFYFVGKGSFQATTQWVGTPWAIGSTDRGCYGSATVGYDFDLVFFRCTDAYVLPVNLRLPGDSARTVRAVTQPTNYGNPGVNRIPDETTELPYHTVYFWCFRSMRYVAPPAHGAGVQLLNADGSLCYDTSLRPVRVVDRLDAAQTQFGQAPKAATIGNDNFASARFGRWADVFLFTSNGQYAGRYQDVAIKHVAGGFTARAFLNSLYLYSVPYQPTPPVGFYDGGILSVDVSGY